MKKLIFLILIFNFTMAMAQNDFNYDSEWKKIEQQENKGLNKSLLTEVNLIFDQAKKENNAQQKIRALFYQSRILLETADNDSIELEIVRNFENEIEKSKGIEKQLLESMLAEMYMNYYRSNRWDIDSRTELAENKNTDFRFWTGNQFREQINQLYLNSLKNTQKLKNEPISNWDYLLFKEKETQKFRPTLYDFLAYRALDYFTKEKDYYNQPKFDAEEEAQKKQYIQLIYNDLIDFHRINGNQDALAYNEVQLLNFRRPELGEGTYETGLMELLKTHSNNAYSPYILMDLAKLYQEKVGKTDKDDFSKRKELTEKSISYLDKINNQFPKSPVREQAEKVKKGFYAVDLNIQIEDYIPTAQNTPFRVEHKNLDKIYLKILKYDDSKSKYITNFNYAEDKSKQSKLNELVKALDLGNDFVIDLKSFDDFQNHATIAKLNPLSAGQYLILASNRPDYKIDDDFVLKYQIVNVTDYSIVFRNDEILVTERISGKPLVGKKVEVRRNSEKNKEILETLTTNEFGLAKLNLTSNDYYRNYLLSIAGESVNYSSNFYYSQNEIPGKTTKNIKFFTDRGIYRPGQTVYFKAISYTEYPDQTKKVNANEFLMIQLKDPNGKSISDLKLITNEFGSVWGEFVLPTSGITGQFVLEAYDGNYSFSVEEYKRPKFEVVFDKVEDIFKLDEEAHAKGKATAYSGANIDNAKVVYRVYRQAIYPYRPWWFWGRFPQSEPEEEITQGETITDAEGKFEIKFTTKPAASTSVNRKGNPRTYTYRIVADVTDINGETRSSQQSITVGDYRFRLEIPLGDKVEISKLDSLTFETQNLNGQFAAAKGKISLTKINPPDRILRDSPLKTGDYELYSKSDFISYFPNETYGEENQKENWHKENPVLDLDFDTGKSKTIHFETKNWKEGYYILKAFIQDGNDEIPIEKLVYLYKDQKKNPVDNEIFSIQTDKNQYKPGEIATLNMASATQDSEVLIQLEVDNKIIHSEKIKLNQNVNTYKIPIKEAYRGNVFVHYYFGKFNTTQAGKLTVSVPFEDTSLKITVGTLRDKLAPGQKETWELTVSEKNKDKFLAEMLTTMYDKSLDQFRSNSIDFPIGMNYNYSKIPSWNTYSSFRIMNFNPLSANKFLNYSPSYTLAFDRLNWFNFDFGNFYFRDGMLLEEKVTAYSPRSKRNMAMAAPTPDGEVSEEADDIVLGSVGYESGGLIKNTLESIPEDPNLSQVVARKALQETAFFYPNLRTDENGNIKIQFTTPESLTAWKFMAMAHTPELNTGYFETTVLTQKDLMVVPNPPRFLREGDEITFSSKINNLSDKELNGQAKLMLFDAFSMQALDDEFGNLNSVRNFKVSKGQSDNVSWQLSIPKNIGAVVYRVVASVGDFSDGEESALPILTNRMMVTETLPISVREGQTKTFELKKLKNNTSKTLDNFKLTFEMTTNPIWYAIFSLPYLREYPYECSEQIFARLYGNLISQHLIHSNPKIKAVFDDWNQKGELKSKLEQNQELKSLLLEETPWVRQAESEEEQMKRIAVLFDLNQMSNELANTFSKLQNKQSSNGGFPWFEGGTESRYITTHIVSGFGHLQKMDIDLNAQVGANPESILKNAIRFIDGEMAKDWDKFQKNSKLKPSNYDGIQYLYARSYFLDKYPLSAKGNQIRDYFLRELDKDKFDQSLQTQAMLAMIFNRYGKKTKAVELLKSIKDNSVENDEFGMYWKSNVAGWFWYQAPVETQALLIEAFNEITDDIEAVESMKVWLLKNRQTNRWISTKATTEAVFALMTTGKDWMNAEEGISVKIGGEELDLKHLGEGPQSGSGYVKTSWSRTEIKPEMAEVEVEKSSPGVAWGAMYWQYFEDLDKITVANTGVRFKKELFLKRNSDKGPVLTKITETTPIQIGDLVTVRLEIQTDREMEFVHIKDMRASGFEPVNVISSYKWKGGLGFYESTRDAATNFFVDRMPKGTFVFEYDVRANNAGNFSNGITSLQNMYAPELSAHSEGIRVEIKK